MRLHETRLIDRPLGEVFAFTADFSNAERWDPGVAQADQVEGAVPGVGARYELIVSFWRSKIPMTYTTTVYEPDARVVLEGRGESISALDDIRFEARDGKTLVDYTADLSFSNWFRFAAPLLAPVLGKLVGEKALDGLVEALEQ